MAKITMLGGYGPGDSFGGIYRAFKRAGHDVTHAPSMPSVFGPLPPGDILFTWNCGSNNIPRSLVADSGFKHTIFWSCDDPHFGDKQRITDVAFQHDIILTCCPESVDTYKAIGAKRVYFLPPAYDPLIYRHDLPADPRYQADVSFACTNLYIKKDWPATMLDRKSFIEAMRQQPSSFKLWGTAHFKDLYGYQGHLTWMEIPHMHVNTKINVNANADTGVFTFNERFFSIVGVQKAQFVDRVKGYDALFKDGENIVFYSSLAELLDKIKFYLDKPELLNTIAGRATELLGSWDYDCFAHLVMEAVDGKDIKPPFMEHYKW